MSHHGISTSRSIIIILESVFAGQSVILTLTHQVATEGLSSDEADFEDLGRNANANADLYIILFKMRADDA